MVIEANKTAVIVTDMWDRHYCTTFSEWVDELAGRLQLLNLFRRHNIPVIWMAEDVMESHELEPGYKALQAYDPQPSQVTAPYPYPEPPGSDYEARCVCPENNCPPARNWTRLHPGADRHVADLLGNRAMHLPLLSHHGIETVIYAGISSNICMLNTRLFSLYQTQCAGYKCLVLGRLTEAYVPGTGRDEGSRLTLDYIGQHLAPVVDLQELDILGKGVWNYR